VIRYVFYCLSFIKLTFIRCVNLLPPPDDVLFLRTAHAIYVEYHKFTLLHTGPGISANIDSARGNLVGTFVNAFVNAGFGNDKLMVTAEEGSSWIYKNKDHGM
jgi:hypothetical protein